MTPLPIIIDFNIFKNGLYGLTSISEVVEIGAFAFYATKEVFSTSVVIGIALTTHALPYIVEF